MEYFLMWELPKKLLFKFVRRSSSPKTLFNPCNKHPTQTHLYQSSSKYQKEDILNSNHNIQCRTSKYALKPSKRKRRALQKAKLLLEEHVKVVGPAKLCLKCGSSFCCSCLSRGSADDNSDMMSWRKRNNLKSENFTHQHHINDGIHINLLDLVISQLLV